MKLFKPPRPKEMLDYLTKTGLSTRQIALGVAVGNFVGILPLVGLHTVAGIAAAHLLRLNQAVVFMGAQVSNPITFPFILVLSAQIGSLILHGTLLELRIEGINIIEYYLIPVIVGGFVLALTVATVFYFVVLRVVGRIRKETV